MTKLIRLTAILFFFLSFIAPTLKAEKHALIIAIGDYPEEGKWPDISSQNDVIHIESMLDVLGFKPNNIIKIQDEQATKADIISALKQLTSRLKEGDMVYIHFSGHGQQVLDQNGDEIDRLDEAIVPYDSPLFFEEGVYEGENLLRDDELGSHTYNMRKKCGPKGQIILILDSCHSGTGVRGMGKVRGTNKAMAPSSFNFNLSASESVQGIENDGSELLAPLGSFFGASPRELNYETKDAQSRPVGSLSFAITSELSKMKKSYSFDQLFDRVKMKMKQFAPRQNPQFEGAGEVLVFDGSTTVKSSNKYDVIEILPNGKIKAGIGTISGVYAGTKVKLISANDDNPVSSGTVEVAHLTTSILSLEKPTDLPKDQLYYISIDQKTLPAVEISIINKVENNSNWHRPVERALKTSMVTSAIDNADIYITEKDGVLSLDSKEGISLYKEQFVSQKIDTYPKQIANIIKAYLQGKFIRSYEHTANNFDFDIQLEIVDCNNQKSINSVDVDKVKVGNCVRFKVKNNGLKGGYFSIIDIQPDNLLNLVVPAVDLGYTADEYYLEGGAEYVTNYPIEIAQPLGEEALKLIVSKNPLDLAGIITTQGRNTRGIGDKSTFEKMMVATYGTMPRGTKIKRKPAEEVSVKTLYFVIEE